MPTKYSERLKLPLGGSEGILFSTANGLLIAKGYHRVLLSEKGPYIEFSEDQIDKENVFIPEQQKWRLTNPASNYVEYRSKDYCSVKIMKWKKEELRTSARHQPFRQEPAELKAGMFYISPFALRSDKVPVLISLLQRRRTISA